jgi:hypothetical protein
MQLLNVEWHSSDASEDDLANSNTLAAIAKELLEMVHACRNAWCNKAQCTRRWRRSALEMSIVMTRIWPCMEYLHGHVHCQC